MEDVVETLTRGNPTEVKVILASVALALAVYQLAVIAVGYGKLRMSFLDSTPAFGAHRAVGDTIALLLLCTGVMCVSASRTTRPATRSRAARCSPSSRSR